MSEEANAIQVEMEDVGPCSKRLSITVPAERVDREIEDTYRSVQRSVQFPGFRAGKAPRQLVEARLGPRVLADVKERLVSNAVDQAIAEKELEPVGQAQAKWEEIELKKSSDLSFAVTVDVRPEFELADLATVEVTRPRLEVTDEHVEEQLQALRRDRATVGDGGDEPLAENWKARLEVKLEVDGETVIEANDVEWAHPSDVLGGLFVEGFADAMIGKKKGDEAVHSVTLPDNFFEEAHRGKEAQITTVIERTEKVELPEMNDEFAVELDYDDLDELRGELRRQLERSLEDQQSRALDDAIVAALLDAMPFDLPPSLIKQETSRMLARYQVQMRQEGIPEEQILEELGKAHADAESRVVRDLRASFILDRVASERKVFATESEVDAEISRMAGSYNSSVADMEDYLQKNNLMPTMRASLREKKTLAELRGVVQIVDASVEGEEGEPK